ncbi:MULTISPECIES: DUF1707 domain-containing protein [Aeromicrobium]|uniref:DUF1707 SHOCT-like domain-containing protein n=1 Tax=Aeromicrobium TaxID=2040 RepID=UPI0009E9183A|nr:MULTISPECIES: DUF1707 domain-containing protein [Aeromicrobium]MBD8608236.1 DUF1707 domain-containing protein [Aeromicrobium sp. CFBP 8757]MCL8250316.1 DUF1707 domain-containing protein [Aeromicrobium fastidiosum]
MPGADVWGSFSADPRDPTVAHLRASDADRDRAVDVVRDAFVDGRLTRDEFDTRRDAVLQARTVGDLVPPMRDLVPTSGRAVRRTAPSPVGTSDLARDAVQQYRRDLRDARNGWIFVTTLCVAIWGATSVAGGGPSFFWPVFPSLGIGIGYFSTWLRRDQQIEQIEEKLVREREAREVRERRHRDY